MTEWKLEYLPEALDDLSLLDGFVRPQVVKGIRKVRTNPLPKNRGGYGTPLGNKGGIDLTTLMKVKFRDIGVRAVYALDERENGMTVIVVSLRSDNQVYREAALRRKKHDL